MISILAIAVIYRMKVGDSPALQSLLNLQDELSNLFSIKIIAVDNTVDDCEQTDIPLGVTYIKNTRNSLSAAYNIAREMAIAEGFEFVLTIDQDTEATIDYFQSLHRAITNGLPDDVVALVPRLISANTQVSPTLASAWPDFSLYNTEGPATVEIAAFNSFNCVRTSYLIHHPYDEKYMIELVDNVFFAELYRTGHKAYLLPATLNHNFSLSSGMMPIGRYKQYLTAYKRFNTLLPLPRRFKNSWRLFRRIFEHLHHRRKDYAAAAAKAFFHCED